MASPMLSDELSTDDLEIAIRLRSVGKVYHIYDKPHDRLKQMLWPGRRRFHREFHALRGVDLEIYRGETVGVVGRNGSGKSTLLKLISGILQPTEGEIEVHGLVAPLLTIGGGFNPEFTGRENVFVNASILGLERHEIEERLDEIIRFADIGAFFDQPVRSYSSGMYSRLAFAVVIHSDPDILIVDEVLAVGDEAFSRKCFSRIEAIKE
jgi:lipopolysaccharide transport system ATP-binding protein